MTERVLGERQEAKSKVGYPDVFSAVFIDNKLFFAGREHSHQTAQKSPFPVVHHQNAFESGSDITKKSGSIDLVDPHVISENFWEMVKNGSKHRVSGS